MCSSCFSRVWLFATPWTLARQAPLPMGFSREEHWSGLPCPLPGDLPHPGIEPMSPVAPALQADSLPPSHWGSPSVWGMPVRKSRDFFWMPGGSKNWKTCVANPALRSFGFGVGGRDTHRCGFACNDSQISARNWDNEEESKHGSLPPRASYQGCPCWALLECQEPHRLVSSAVQHTASWRASCPRTFPEAPRCSGSSSRSSVSLEVRDGKRPAPTPRGRD